MKRLISVFLILCLMIGTCMLNVSAVDPSAYADYPYKVIDCSYNNGTVSVTVQGDIYSLSSLRGIHVSFFRGTNQVISKDVEVQSCSLIDRDAQKLQVTGQIQNTNLPNGDYQLSIAITENTGTNGSKLKYLSDYKILNTTLTGGSIEMDIAQGFILAWMNAIVTGQTPKMQVVSDTKIYTDAACTQEAQILHPGTNDKNPNIYEVYGNADIDTNTAMIIVNGQKYYTHLDTLANYTENPTQTITEQEKANFVKNANKGISQDLWNDIKIDSGAQVNKRIILNDVETGEYFAMSVVGNKTCLKVEPTTVNDTNIIRNLIGKWHNGSRAVWVQIDNTIYPASLSCVLKQPKKNNPQRNNNLDGYLELFFNGSTNQRGEVSASWEKNIEVSFDKGKNIGKIKRTN